MQIIIRIRIKLLSISVFLYCKTVNAFDLSNFSNFTANGIHVNGDIHSGKCLDIKRETFDYDELNSKYNKNYRQELPFWLKIQVWTLELLHSFTANAVLRWFLSLFPIIKWMRVYDWRGAFLNDLIAGFTVSILTIPQGMANGLLSGVTPIEGLYTTFFPVIVYAFMGTSHHMSMGNHFKYILFS